MTLGDLIKKYRDIHNISMDEFSKMCNLSKGYISMLENNTNPRNNKPIAPTLPTVNKIASAMGTDVDSILKALDSNQAINLDSKSKNSIGIGKVLKESRISAKMSVKEISDILVNKGFKASESTIYSWENENSQPTPGAFLVMCRAYGVKNVLSTFGYDEYKEDGTLQLNINEINLVEKYRSLDSSGKQHIDYELNREVSKTEQLQDQQDQIDMLKQRIVTEVAHRIAVPLYDKFASAGSGAYLFDDIPTDIIEVEDTPTARKADFVIGVNGGSMEPDFYDGEKVFVKKASDLNVGDIGIFLKGEDCYIKELGTDRLISHNPDKDRYPDIQADEDVRLIGKVIGKVEED